MTRSAGIHFLHVNSRTPRKYMVETMGSGCAFIDAYGAGRQDVLLINGAPIAGAHVAGRPTMALYRNNGDGTFTDSTHESGLDRQVFYGMGAAVGDYDNDGREDFYVSSALSAGHLFHNEGHGRFKDVTAEAGVGNAGRWGTSCAWLDYDRDGRLDLFVCDYVKYANLKDDLPCYADDGKQRIYCIPAAYEANHSTLYHNEGRGRFRDVTEQSGIGASRTKALGVSVWDYDGDGWPDIFVANDTVAGQLFHNERNGTFRDVGVESGTAYDEEGSPHSGMGIDTGDLLNDGRTWLTIANYQGQQSSLYCQVSPGVFRDTRTESGIGIGTSKVLGFGVLFLDYDNDGFSDVLQVDGHVQDDIETREPGVTYSQPALLFHNLRNGRFAEVGMASGKPFSDLAVARGLATADVRNDGRPYVLISQNGGPARLWRDVTAAGNHWLELKLVGTRSSRDGIGALVTVSAGGTTQRAYVRSGSSYLSQSDLRPRFGLGAASAAAVEIHWPSGTTDRVPSLRADRIYTIREGTAARARGAS